ncbi:putative uncharacterized protein DDB_G0271606 isoform X2 [Drosophila gunungcola]|uniref:putative uncharacterized protein DDB_G0271606 isoform X2 n=1 Tax=Drosophila gunungcola TaxID=103775 RepID=UPI0022E1D459|nr:putative uncharacterized protein DDB_G0271606 isoform X2 [Drosophila gunungcola]
MAATPPMPPGSSTHQLNGKPIGKGNPLTEAINQHFLRKNQNQNQHPHQHQSQNQNPNQNPNPNTNSSASRSGSNEQLELLEHPTHPQQEATSGKAKPSCHCTNISIMHLFHEMKQEFPTIPDAIVTQCVNENCHQRDNCIQMLRKELALHPIPVQSYPAKVLQQQQQHQQQQNNRQAKPPTPLKPSRVAPPQPELGQSNGEATPPSVGNAQPNPPARPRPTTLNLQRQFSTQLQQKIQQRQQRQQHDHQPPQLTPTSLSKPLRRAPPLPPPPKPKPGSFSNDSSCLTSPMSSSESELSLNTVPLSSPVTAPAPAAASASAAIAPVQQQPSPVRHRSVITLQPEPPYARDFRSSDFPTPTPTPPPPLLPSPSSAASPGSAGGRKSFTSLNLTLRQPTGSAQSAIDITAGPAPSGQGSGITYSSVSFDARRGTHKNFQLTVTDEGSVFSAGCIRPRRPYACEPVASVPANQSQPPAPAAVVADGLGDTEMTSDVFPYPTQEQNHIVASNYSHNHAASNNNNNGISSSVDSSPTMPLYEGVLEDCDREAHAATIERQKHRRDKLANALRDNKKKLLVLEQEINILTEPVPVGESERLDRDIMQLTEDCKRLLDCINEPPAMDSGPAANSAMRQHPSSPSNAPQQQQQQPQPQPFPRQRQSVRAQPPPNSLRLHSVPAAPTSQPSLDFGQHHSSAPTSACLTPQLQSQQQQQQQPFQLQQEPPPTYAQYYQFQQYLQQQRQQIHQQQLQLQQQLQQQAQQQLQQQAQQQLPQQEEEFLSDSDVDEEEEPMDSWACNMCTFRNHPQLNICEACENVRIQPAPVLSREDIHITLSPGENRIIHSWILS